MNASSEHVPRAATYNFGEVQVNQTYSYVMMIAPVGPGNLTVGYFSIPGVVRPAGAGSPPPGLFPESVTLPVHVKAVDPVNNILVEKDIVTPGSFTVDFKIRGNYYVYLTNHGNETSPIPIGVTFEEGNLQNREADKYLLGIILTGAGVVFICTRLVIQLVSKQRRQS